MLRHLLTSVVLGSLVLPGLASAYEGISDDICKRTAEDTQRLAFDPRARVAIQNQGGWQGNGVCWWHSRFLRSSLYLAMFRPDLAKPTHEQALGIIEALVNMNHVVIIPGYANFADFTSAYSEAIIGRLGSWQKREFFTGFNFIRANKGSSEVSADSLKSIMERIDDMVNNDHSILFERTKIAGKVTNHAWLIIGSHKTPVGYDITIADSNHPVDNRVISYRFGDTHLKDPVTGWTQVPYLAFGSDMGKILGAVNGYCQNHR